MEQVPVSGPCTIFVLYDNQVSMRTVLGFQATFCAVFLCSYHNTTSCRRYPGTVFHFKINRHTVFMGQPAEITLQDKQRFTFFIWQCIYITGIFFYFSFLQVPELLPHSVLAGRTGKKENN